MTELIQAMAVFAQSIAAGPLGSLAIRNVATWAAGAIVVVDPVFWRLPGFVHRIERCYRWHVTCRRAIIDGGCYLDGQPESEASVFIENDQRGDQQKQQTDDSFR